VRETVRLWNPSNARSARRRKSRGGIELIFEISENTSCDGVLLKLGRGMRLFYMDEALEEKLGRSIFGLVQSGAGRADEFVCRLVLAERVC
jgi:hypothetical protein